MPEGVLGLARHRRLPHRAHELLARELAQGRHHALWVALAHCRESPGPEDLADHRCVGEERLRVRREGVETGGDQRLHRLREGDVLSLLELPTGTHALEQVTIAQQPHELLGVQWVAPGPFEDRLLQLCWDDCGLQECGDEARCLSLRERGEGDRGRVAQAIRVVGVALVELRASRPHEEEGNALCQVCQVLEEGEERLIRPVQVLEDEHGRALLGDSLQEPAPGGEELLALGRGGRLDPEQGEQPLTEPLALVGVGEDGGELLLGDRGRVTLEDAGVRLQDLPERPEGDPFPVGEAASLPPGRELGAGVDVGEKLGDESALAEARLPDDGHELDGARGDRLVEDPLHEGEVDLAADEWRRMGAGEVRAEAGSGCLRLEHPHRRLLSLERRGLELFVVERRRGRLVRRKADCHSHLRGDRLDAGSRVDRISREEALTETRTRPQADERLSGVDPDSEA